MAFVLPQLEWGKLAANGLKYLALLLGVALIGFSLWYGGMRHERSEHAVETTKILERELVVAEKEKAILSREAEENGRRLGELITRLEIAGGNLEDAIKANGNRVGCDLSPDEHKLFNQVRGSSRGASRDDLQQGGARTPARKPAR